MMYDIPETSCSLFNISNLAAVMISMIVILYFDTSNI